MDCDRAAGSGGEQDGSGDTVVGASNVGWRAGVENQEIFPRFHARLHPRLIYRIEIILFATH